MKSPLTILIVVYTLLSVLQHSTQAPTRAQDVKLQQKPHDSSSDTSDLTGWRPSHSGKQDTIKITLELNSLSDDVITAEDFFPQKDTRSSNNPLKTSRRQKRHAIRAEELAEDALPMNRRRRSTAAAMLTAMINLCDQHRHLCRSIKVRDRDIKTTIRLEEM